MSRTPSKPMPADVLDTIRQLVDTGAGARATRPPTLTLTAPITPETDSRINPDPTPPAGDGENRFVDRIVTRLASPGEGDTGPLNRPRALLPDPDAPAPRPATAETDTPCTLLLTPDFLVSPPEAARLPHPVNRLSQDDYAEDSDLDRFPTHDAVSHQPPEMSEALRAVVRKTMRAAFDAAEDTPPAPLQDETGRLDTEALTHLVRGIVQEELRSALGTQISEEIRTLVRAEMSRSLAPPNEP